MPKFYRVNLNPQTIPKEIVPDEVPAAVIPKLPEVSPLYLFNRDETLSAEETERFEERSAIIEYGGNIDRSRSELTAFSEIVKSRTYTDPYELFITTELQGVEIKNPPPELQRKANHYGTAQLSERNCSAGSGNPVPAILHLFSDGSSHG